MRRTAKARCVTTHLWTARLWLACLPSFLSTNGFVMIYSHHQSPLLSPPRQACLRHASRAQARAPTALPLYRFLSNRLTRLSPMLVWPRPDWARVTGRYCCPRIYQVGIYGKGDRNEQRSYSSKSTYPNEQLLLLRSNERVVS